MLSTGVDLIQIARIEKAITRFGQRFLDRIYTPEEVRYSRRRASELAVRFAAKEAVSKALGVGMRVLSPHGIDWLDVEVLNEPGGKPFVILHNHAKHLAEKLGLEEWSISLSHDGGIAIAFVVASQSYPVPEGN
ncbi:MAG: holo-[acyl-carrier-protein] synthase [Anaerolineales bacterium]|nr:MAG: holo-[acyl-carrier-protein] synthase [Anaerolineales bacterium]